MYKHAWGLRRDLRDDPKIRKPEPATPPHFSHIERWREQAAIERVKRRAAFVPPPARSADERFRISQLALLKGTKS